MHWFGVNVATGCVLRRCHRYSGRSPGRRLYLYNERQPRRCHYHGIHWRWRSDHDPLHIRWVCHEVHRGICVLLVHLPDLRYHPQQRHLHRGLCVLRLRLPGLNRIPGTRCADYRWRELDPRYWRGNKRPRIRRLEFPCPGGRFPWIDDGCGHIRSPWRAMIQC